MPKKNLKTKLRSESRKLKKVIAAQHTILTEQHTQAGLTINYESQKIQAIAMAHGLMATLVEAKKHFDENHSSFKALEHTTQLRIAQCISTLMQMGLSGEEANEAILRGH